MTTLALPVRVCLTVVLVGVAGLLLPRPAVAATDTHRDASHDVHASRPGYEGPARGAPFADLTRVESTYRHRRLVLRTRFAELVSRPQHTLYVGIDIETSDDRRFAGQLIYSSDHGISSIILVGDDDRPRDCFAKALSGHVDAEGATISVTIPARCLGRPDRVRTGARSFVTMSERRYRTWRDDARAPYRRPDPGHVYAVPTYGPEIERG